MILSFHPLFRGDANILCAGRDPGREELAAIQSATVVILPQGCTRRLYEMARANCRRVFPNYDARFRFPGKTGQIRLFREWGIPHPATEAYESLADFRNRNPSNLSFGFPLVFKFDWGGEGDTVFLAENRNDLDELLVHAARCERSGQRGFLLQQFVSCQGRSLRVAVIGKRLLSYWRVTEGPGTFKASLSGGARVDTDSDPLLKKAAESLVAGFCRDAGINLAGLDLIYADKEAPPTPLLLEINYFFGRVGLGGSAAYYKLLEHEIRGWITAGEPAGIDSTGAKRRRPGPGSGKAI
ncbi:MAG: glutathione synthase [Desulfobacterales bacterium]|jgi:ribosomal protein S6--L-glutamate ligase|nr:glutathione synthase [Desulfobacterales bacterium]